MPAAIAQFTIMDYNDITVGATAPANPTVDQLWLNTSVSPNRLSRWSGSAWVLATPTSASQVGAEATIYKQAAAPAHSNGRLWLQTGVVPNVLWRSTGSAWEKVTPTSPGEVGAYPSTDGSNLENRIYSAEQKITPEAIVNTFTEEYSKDDTKAITKGIVTMNRYGITVSKSTSEINSQLANDGVTVRDGDAPLAIFGEAGAIIPKVESNVLNFSDKTGVYYVGGAYPYKSISECLNALFTRNDKIHIGPAGSPNSADIYIEVFGNINETVRITGLSGRGRLIIRINAGVTFNGNFELYGNTLPIYIIGAAGAVIKNPGNVSGYMFQVSACKYVQVNSLNLDNNSGYYLTYVTHGSTVHFENCDVIGCNYMVQANNASSVTVVNCKGNVISGVLRLVEGAKGYISGSAPAGGALEYSTNKFIFTDGTVARVDSAYSPPPITSKEFVQVFNGATFDTLVHGTSNVNSYYGASAAQNRWDSSVSWCDGRIRFGSEVYNFFNGGSNISIRMRLRRKNTSHGSSAAVMPAPYNHSASFPSGATRGGWTGWATVPSSLFTSGGATLTYYNGVQGINGYAIWDAVEVEVTVTKQV
jgi:hypothetical protein